MCSLPEKPGGRPTIGRVPAPAAASALPNFPALGFRRGIKSAIINRHPDPLEADVRGGNILR